MRRKLLLAAIVVMALVGLFRFVGSIWATPPHGYETRTIARGVGLESFDVSNQPTQPNGSVWRSWQKTEGESDLYVQGNLWLPRGTTGWHSHPGHSLIIVTEGTVTNYEGDDPNCTPHVYTKGMTFVDHGGHHVHLVRNETNAQAATIAVQLIPAGAKRRIDEPDPGICHF